MQMYPLFAYLNCYQIIYHSLPYELDHHQVYKKKADKKYSHDAIYDVCVQFCKNVQTHLSLKCLSSQMNQFL